MGAKQPRGLNLILLVVHGLAELLPVPYLAKVIGILREFVKEYADDEDSQDFKEVNLKLNQLLEKTRNPGTDHKQHIEDVIPSYSGVFGIMRNNLAIKSLILRTENLLDILTKENIILDSACFLGNTGVSHKLSSLFYDQWPQKYSDAVICANSKVLKLTFPSLRAYVTLDGDVRRHVKGAFKIPLETKAHFELLTAYGTKPVLTGQTGQIYEIVLSGPVEITVPGMRATKLEILENLDNSKNEQMAFVLIVPSTTAEEFKNERTVTAPLRGHSAEIHH